MPGGHHQDRLVRWLSVLREQVSGAALLVKLLALIQEHLEGSCQLWHFWPQLRGIEGHGAVVWPGL